VNFSGFLSVSFLCFFLFLGVSAMKKFMRQRVSRQQAMQLDSSENNPMENISTTMMLNMTRRTEDFPLFFDKHGKREGGGWWCGIVIVLTLWYSNF
jgi:hypothetical protein